MVNNLGDGDQPVRSVPEGEHHQYLYGRKVQCNLCLPQEMIDWLRAQPIGMGKTVTNLIKAEMEKEKPEK